MSLRRREFIAALGGAAAAWPLAAGAQQRAMPVVGWLSTRNSETDANVLPAFRRGLNKQGYVEGRNVTIEYRWSDTQNDLLPALAEDLVRRQVAVLVTAGDSEAVVRAIQAITTMIPIVRTITSRDTAFSRPAGNVTGAYSIFAYLGGETHRASARRAAPRNHDCCFGDSLLPQGRCAGSGARARATAQILDCRHRPRA
jgi:putative ABC transport system substrate-binding protein